MSRFGEIKISKEKIHAANKNVGMLILLIYQLIILIIDNQLIIDTN